MDLQIDEGDQPRCTDLSSGDADLFSGISWLRRSNGIAGCANIEYFATATTMGILKA